MTLVSLFKADLSNKRSALRHFYLAYLDHYPVNIESTDCGLEAWMHDLYSPSAWQTLPFSIIFSKDSLPMNNAH